MNSKRIQKVEEKIKSLHLYSKIKKHSSTNNDAQDVIKLFWYVHIKSVIDCAKRLAKKYKANQKVVWLSAIFHDIARLDDLEPHDIIGAGRAYKELLKMGFDKKVADEVKNTILTHRCRERQPKTLEQKILATADAMSHFEPPFYLWFSSISKKPFKEQLESNLKKIERDFKKKIFFKDEKYLVRKKYLILKDWCKYYLKIK